MNHDGMEVRSRSRIIIEGRGDEYGRYGECHRSCLTGLQLRI